ncbi:hypothetical protein Cgig2_018643 [Carnegiea gigantea]|uniref:Uncharacterized protein n=1 Tax=Carnegiea gigantea TaxID=171969 RepID=A0A9Q1KFN5_9CARY|nr:hypothetical protein Cgig2_018643 [Carnegiea gigantea]
MEGTMRTEEKYPGLREGSWFNQFLYGSNPWMARYVYGLIFLITNFLAWAVRDYGQSAMKELHRLEGCRKDADCLGTKGVLRMFFIAMFLSTVGTTKVDDCRDTWSSGWWSAKALMFLGFMTLPFLLPSSLIYLYDQCWLLGTWANGALPRISLLVCHQKSFITALLTIVIATFSTGIDSQCFQFCRAKKPAENGVPYGYGFFHFVFATGAMYFAMLLIGWNTHHPMKNLDAGGSCDTKEETNR